MAKDIVPVPAGQAGVHGQADADHEKRRPQHFIPGATVLPGSGYAVEETDPSER